MEGTMAIVPFGRIAIRPYIRQHFVKSKAWSDAAFPSALWMATGLRLSLLTNVWHCTHLFVNLFQPKASATWETT
jgi:hypothetical protein